jgi:hypothetical protein
MRRLLFLLSCGLIAWAMFTPERVTHERSTAEPGTFEERVVAMVRAREVVGRRMTQAVNEVQEKAEAAREKLEVLAGRLPVGGRLTLY